jgi:hypothetical protein
MQDGAIALTKGRSDEMGFLCVTDVSFFEHNRLL